MHQDTDYTQAVHLKYLSPTWVKTLDEQYGTALLENNGHVEFHAKFEGEPRPRWYRKLLTFLPYGKKSPIN